MVAMLTKRMLEAPLPEPPLPDLHWWSLLWLSLTVLLRNAADEHGTPRCPGSWKTQCTWLRVRGRLCVTPDTVHRKTHRERMTLIIFEIFNVHTMYVASLSCLCPIRDGRRAL